MPTWAKNKIGNNNANNNNTSMDISYNAPNYQNYTNYAQLANTYANNTNININKSEVLFINNAVC